MPKGQESHQVTATIVNRLGLHARPAMAFVDLAGTFACEIEVSKDGQAVDGKSIMQVMMLAAGKGAVLTISAKGADACKACETLKKLIEGGFEED